MASPALSNLQRGFVVCVAASALITAGVIAVRSLNSVYQRSAVATALTQGDAARAPALLRRYGCTGCHTIPGIAGADGKVGGDLSGLRSRVYIAGVLPNNAGNLIRWIVAPRSINPRTAMPDTGITESEARDAAAYLYQQ